MMDLAISPRYAKVLFDLDCIKGNLKRRLGDFESMIKVLNENPKLTSLLKAPHVILKDKKTVLQHVLKGKLDQTFINFLFYLIQKGRFVNLSHIANEYRLMVNKYFGIWEADIVTAVPMDVDSETKLKQKLEKDFHKKINLNKKVDPKIIGGAILVIANEMLDWSVVGRLKKLKENLYATQV